MFYLDSVIRYNTTGMSDLKFEREIIAVCSQIHTKHINTLCGQNVDFHLNRNYI